MAASSHSLQADWSAPYPRHIIQHPFCARKVEAPTVILEVVDELETAVDMHLGSRNPGSAIVEFRRQYGLTDRVDVFVGNPDIAFVVGLIDKQIQLLSQFLRQVISNKSEIIFILADLASLLYAIFVWPV